MNEINIFGSAIINSAPAFLSGDYILGLEMFIQNINVQSLAEYAYDLQHDSYRIDRAEVYQQIVSNSKKMMLLKAENAGNAELLRNYQKEINNLKRRINAL